MITLTEGDYSISDSAGHLQVILNHYFNDVEFPPQRSDMFVVNQSILLNKIRISVNYNDIGFQIIPDSDISTHPEWFPDINVNSLNSINKVLQNYHVATYDCNTSYYSGFVDLQRVNSLHLHCSESSNYNKLTVAGNSSIVKKINVTVPYLGVISDLELSNFDY